MRRICAGLLKAGIVLVGLGVAVVIWILCFNTALWFYGVPLGFVPGTFLMIIAIGLPLAVVIVTVSAAVSIVRHATHRRIKHPS